MSTGGVDLPASAQAAWRAYLDLLERKDAHFGYLVALDAKYRHGGRRTLAELSHLAELLAAHDRAVGRFSARLRDLAQRDRPAHTLLVAALTEINQSPGAGRAGPAH